jgi:spermidine/putrescine transport system permease protein
MLVLLTIVPLAFIVYYAFVKSGYGATNAEFTFNNLVRAVTDAMTLRIFGESVLYGLLATLICLVIGYPVAYILSQSKFKMSSIFIMLFLLPMWVNFLIRVLALKSIFYALDISLGKGTALFGMVYDFLPFMILPIYSALLKVDTKLLDAAADLGANPRKVILKTVMPLSIPGVVSGILMVFMPSITAYAITDTLSGGRFMLIGSMINISWANNMNFSAALSLVLLVVIFITMIVGYKFGGKHSKEVNSTW